MRLEITFSHDGKTMDVFIPIKLGRKSGRTKIVSPDGQPVNRDRNAEQDAAIRDALIQAHKWQNMLDTGKFKNARLSSGIE